MASKKKTLDPAAPKVRLKGDHEGDRSEQLEKVAARLHQVLVTADN